MPTRGPERAGLLREAIGELPAYLDLANEECGPFVLACPAETGVEVATELGFPAAWCSPK